MSDDPRFQRLVALLRAAGVGSECSIAGAQRDIAVIHGAAPVTVRAHAEHIRALGFRHVTVDLGSDDGHAPG